MSVRKIQVAITIGAVVIALIHLIWPEITIDNITVILLVIAIVPWLIPLFKSIEFPGGWKIEFQDMQKAKDKAAKVGLLADQSAVKEPEYTYQQIFDQDPNLALAGLRIEIEKRLIQIADANGILLRRSSVGELLRALSEQELITHGERGALADIIGLLNSAVHGAEVDSKAADVALQIGPRILKSLDEKMPKE